MLLFFLRPTVKTVGYLLQKFKKVKVIVLSNHFHLSDQLYFSDSSILSSMFLFPAVVCLSFPCP